MKILLTAGPIPGRLDSVKFVTNRFKGGLMLAAANKLSVELGHTVTILKWKHLELYGVNPDIEVIDVEDVHDYVEKVTEHQYDAYLLGAAVANIIPKNPWEGKFPSHNYKVGDTISVDFEIAPRAIDEVKKKYPRSLLIGYKLFDGEDVEIIRAGWHTLVDSKANVVFCNHPKWAKEKKIALLPDGTRINMDMDQHIHFIDRMTKLQWYSTAINESKTELPENLLECLDTKLRWVIDNMNKDLREFSGYDFGSVAMRYKDGFITTTRGKFFKTGPEGKLVRKYTFVKSVDHVNRIVNADDKATLNAPLLHKLFSMAPDDYNLILHGHFYIEGDPTYDYMFPGTTDENKPADDGCLSFNVKGHGCYLVSKC